MSPAPAFSPRVAVALGGLVLVIFAASLLLTGRGGRDTGESFGANTYSRSAIGHLALYDMLRALGRNSVRADVDPLAQLGAKGVLVLAEPSETALKIWNRMSSGTYFPPPVRAVSIPKKSGGEGFWVCPP